MFLVGLALPMYCYAGILGMRFWLFPRHRTKSESLLCVAMGSVFGMVAASACWFLGLRVFGASGPTIVAPIEIVAIATAIWLLRRSERRRPDINPVHSDDRPPSGDSPPRWLVAVFGFAVLATLAAVILHMVRVPHGLHDAIAMWNLRARGLFWLSGDWQDVLRVLTEMAAPDHPLMLPGTVYRVAGLTGGDLPLAGPITAVAFAGLLLTILCSGVACLRDSTLALLAGLLLIASRVFPKLTASQLADVPIATLQLSSFVLLTFAIHRPDLRSRFLLAAGAAASATAFMKNEGSAFLVGFLLAAGFLSRRRLELPAWRVLVTLTVGALPMLAVVAVFKSSVSIENEVLGPARVDQWQELLQDPRRYAALVDAFADRFLNFGNFSLLILPVVVGLACLLGPRSAPRGACVASYFGTEAIVFSMVALVYVLSPFGTETLASWSLKRLIFQAFPAYVFVLICLVPTSPKSEEFN